MGRICAAICTSHSPYIHASPEEWEPARAARAAKGGIAPHVPIDSPEENRRKHERSAAALAVLRAQIQAAHPDVIVICGDDQSEQLDFRNYPALAVFAGDGFSGFKVSDKFGLPVPGVAREQRPKTPEHWVSVPGHPAFARELLVGLMRREFDVAFSLELPKPEIGMGHAFMRPLRHLTPEFDIATVPVFVNCYFGPQPTGRRCVQLGRALRAVIEEMAAPLNVALVGSGGLWHMPMFPAADIDAEFDRTMLALLAKGDAAGMGAYFDSRAPVAESADARGRERLSGGTGMILGSGGGTGETRNWIVTAAAMEGRGATIVDYVPVHASPVGLGFAYWSIPHV